MISVCLLCDRPLKPFSPWRQRHPAANDCNVRITDAWGIAVDEAPVQVRTIEPEVPLDTGFLSELNLDVFPPVDEVFKKVFRDHGVDRLGGISSGHGWSMFSSFQLCNKKFELSYLRKRQPSVVHIEPEARAIGTIIHTYLAVYYMQMINPDYPLTPESIHDAAMQLGNPKLLLEGWRCFNGYQLWYRGEKIIPLGVEYGLRDPRNNESCRYDLIAYFPETVGDRLPGTYVIEHKSAGRFDATTLDGWRNDGEVLGQIMLWKRLGLDKRFGPLRGVMVNIIGKQVKEQKFHRTIVPPDIFMVNQHTEDLKIWEARIQTAVATNSFPRSRANCISRYGFCDHYSFCAGEDL